MSGVALARSYALAQRSQIRARFHGGDWRARRHGIMKRTKREQVKAWSGDFRRTPVLPISICFRRAFCSEPAAPEGGGRRSALVAGGGIEPPTSGL